MFYVKRYYFLPDVAEISYFTVKHISLVGVVVHDKSTVQDKTRYAKHISNEIKEFVQNLYHAGVPIAQIHSMHMATIIHLRDEGNLVVSRDCFLSEDNVRNVCGLQQKDLYMKHSNDARIVYEADRDTGPSVCPGLSGRPYGMSNKGQTDVD